MTKNDRTPRKSAPDANFSSASSGTTPAADQSSPTTPTTVDSSFSTNKYIHPSKHSEPTRPHPVRAFFDEPIPERTLFSGSSQLPTPASAAPTASKSSRRTRTDPPAPARERSVDEYAKPFCEFLTANPTVFHTVAAFARELEDAGFSKLSGRDAWELETGGKYYTERNGSSLIAFVVGDDFEPGNGAAIVAGHVDVLTAKLKPISKLPTKAGFVQLGVAPYAGALSSTWWDRDLGVGGRVLVKESSGKVVSKLVKLDYPIARIPTLAPHFGAVASGPFNKETQMVPVIAIDNSDSFDEAEGSTKATALGGEGTFAATQPGGLVEAIAGKLGISDYSSIVNWELELFDFQPATLGGLHKDFIFAGRIDDRLCSWAALQALLNDAGSSSSGRGIKMTAFFDDEEIGSLLRQGARGNFLPATLERIVDAFHDPTADGPGAGARLRQTAANSFLVSSDVTHAVNPNFLGAYLPHHAPRLNVGVAVSADSNGHMTTDAVSTALFQRCAARAGATLQVFQIRNDVRSGGTVGPMLSAATGVRAIDVGIPQLSMHSIRATTGARDPGLGVQCFQAFLEHYASVDEEFRD